MPKRLLLQTPDPRPYEGFFGYVLRVSEANCYESPWHVFRYAGYSQDELLKASITAGKLAEVLGKHPDALQQLSYRSGNAKAAYVINGRPIGRSLSGSPLRLRHSAICPECVQEVGFAKAAWDATSIVACPIHRRYLIDRCPVCEQRLTWFRPGLLACRCGSSLSMAPVVRAPDTVVALMRVLMHKIEGIGPLPLQDLCGLPVPQLENVSLESMLRLVSVLQRAGVPRRKGTELGRLVEVSDAFSNWPRGFHAYLRKVSATRGAAAVGFTGLCKHFGPLYEGLLREQIRHEAAGFLRDELVRFGLQDWGEGSVDVKALRGVDPEARFVSGAAIAAKVGARPITIRKWVDKGTLQAKTMKAGRQRRFVADVGLHDGVERGPEGRVQYREAGRLSGMPVAVLQELKRSGHYSTSAVANSRTGYWLHDLQRLSSRLLATAKEGTKVNVERTSDGELVSLGRVLQYWKLGDRSAKAKLIAAILDGAIVPSGSDGKAWQSLEFLVEEIEAFRIRNAFESGRSIVADSAAASFLGVDNAVATALAAVGHLRRARRTAGLTGVTRESVTAFAERWRALCALARKAGTSSKALVVRAEKLGVDLMWVTTPYETRAPFCRSADEAKLLGLHKVLPSALQGGYDSVKVAVVSAP